MKRWKRKIAIEIAIEIGIEIGIEIDSDSDKKNSQQVHEEQRLTRIEFEWFDLPYFQSQSSIPHVLSVSRASCVTLKQTVFNRSF